MAIDKPIAGDATRKTLIDAVIDALSGHDSVLGGVRSLALPNGSFESDSDNDGIPDGWTFTAYQGGTLLLLGPSGTAHGIKAARITNPGGGGANGGGYLESDFIEASPRQYYQFDWELLCSVANAHTIVQVAFYNSSQSLLSSAIIHSDATNNPISVYTHQFGGALAPSGTRYLKVRFIGGFAGSAASVTTFDNTSIRAIFHEREDEFLAAGTYQIRVPDNTWVMKVELFGAGGNGGSSGSSDGGGGGGGGGYVLKYLQVVPGAVHQLIVGAGGAPGGATTLAGLSAGGGVGGAAGNPGPAPGGAGGVGSGGDINITGGTGSTGLQAGAGGDGGAGGARLGYGMGSPSTPGAGTAGPRSGGGGGARNAAGGAGGSGSARIAF